MKVLDFIKEVKVEAGKVVWPAKQEILMMSAMVVVVACLASLFFLLIDGCVYRLVQFVLGI